MTARRNPMRDEIAIVGLGSTDFTRDAGGRSAASLAAEACINAIHDAGIDKSEIDGVVGALEPGAPRANQMSSILGLSDITHHSSPMPVAIFGLVDAMTAIYCLLGTLKLGRSTDPSHACEAETGEA